MWTSIRFLYERLIEPRSTTEDAQRRELILNIFLFSALALSAVALIKNQSTLVRLGSDYTGAAPFVVPLAFTIFLALSLLSRLGLVRLAAYMLAGIYYAGATYTLYHWGVDAPFGLLLYALVIVMSGVLISTRFSVLVAVVVGVTLITLQFLVERRLLTPTISWHTVPWRMDDTIFVLFIFGVISVVSWLANREIERSLQRARASEAALKQERDLLEEKVEERTRALRQAQFEKSSHLYRLATFGRLAAGLFHDVMSPLTAVSLNLEQLDAQSHKTHSRNLADLQATLQRALKSTKNIEEYVRAARKQLQGESEPIRFETLAEIQQALQVLSYRARLLRIKLTASATEPIQLFGDPIKFHQVVSNLVNNSLDAYEGLPLQDRKRQIVVTVARQGTEVQIRVQDWGKGIPVKHQIKIFEPFFTTKDSDQGLGIGLAITKEIVEKDFHGSIVVESVPGKETTFTIRIPLTP